MPEPCLKSSLTMEEIENNFKDTDFFAEVMEGLGEVLTLVQEEQSNLKPTNAPLCFITTGRVSFIVHSQKLKAGF